VAPKRILKPFVRQPPESKIFYLNPRNSLKSPHSEKEIKGNESLFPFISFQSLSIVCFCLRRESLTRMAAFTKPEASG
jgi:hypothetical protein